jgi:hypothetical protein
MGMIRPTGTPGEWRAEIGARPPQHSIKRTMESGLKDPRKNKLSKRARRASCGTGTLPVVFSDTGCKPVPLR